MIYIASPYSGELSDKEYRYEKAMQYAAWLVRRKLVCYSPIVSWHPTAMAYDLPGDHEFWLNFDAQVMSRCDDMHVLKLPGWDVSKGVQWEIKYWNTMHPEKPPFYIEQDWDVDKVGRI